MTQETQNFDLFIGYLGNGLTVADRQTIVDGDYKRICHIDEDRTIRWAIKNPSQDLVAYITEVAQTPYIRASCAQDYNVFSS